MAKDKQQKKKERERRVAQKKLQEAKKRAEEMAATGKKDAPKTSRILPTVPVPKADYSAAKTSRRPHIHRKSGGGG